MTRRHALKAPLDGGNGCRGIQQLRYVFFFEKERQGD
jgi:hypothetical protein